MRQKILIWLACPVCGSPFELEGVPRDLGDESEFVAGVLACDGGHRFPIERGVPRLRLDHELGAGASGSAAQAAAGRTIGESFGIEWEHFDYDDSRTWHQTVEERRQLFLQEIDTGPDDMRGKVVLDAGCGNGSLSEGISRFGCEVIAVDVSDSVTRAHEHCLQRGSHDTYFVQGDLLHLPLRRGIADILYSSGVLHHNPDTHEAFEAVAPFLKPDGRMYIWVYEMQPDLKFALQLRLRSVISPLPMPIRRAFVYVWSIQSMARQYLRTLLGTNDETDRLSWKERVVDLMDIYTPRYRWMHTEDEVKGWYQQRGMEARVTETRDWGFGVLGVASPSEATGSTASSPSGG